jgi:protein-S-isoprenylcysteine O-methyltransferase Ste14
MRFFDYFQIISLGLFYLVFVGRMLQMLAAGTNPLVIGSGKKGFGRILEAGFMAGLLIWSLEVVTHSLRIDLHVFPDFLYAALFEIVFLKLIGVILIIAGILVFVASLVSFGESWRIGIDTKKPDALVTSGIFSLTRNPIFLFLDMYVIGTWLIYPNLFFGIAAIITIGGIHWQILQEEAFLSRQYGEEYQDYIKAVRRYI